MLSCSLDPDQDLQSGSKLDTWYDECCNSRGGGGGGGGGYVLVVKFSGGDYVLVVKFSGGDYVLVVKFMGGILYTYTKMSRGGFVRGGGGGGILSYTPTYQVPRSSALWFWRRRFFKGFYHIWAWRPSWSCDQDHLNKL